MLHNLHDFVLALWTAVTQLWESRLNIEVPMVIVHDDTNGETFYLGGYAVAEDISDYQGKYGDTMLLVVLASDDGGPHPLKYLRHWMKDFLMNVKFWDMSDTGIAVETPRGIYEVREITATNAQIVIHIN